MFNRNSILWSWRFESRLNIVKVSTWTSISRVCTEPQLFRLKQKVMMESLFMETNVLLQQIHTGLAKLERAATPEEGKQIENEVSQQLEMIAATCERLEVLAGKEPVARRRNSKYRVDQLKYDSQHLRASLYGLQQKLAMKWRYSQERDDLLTRRFTANNDSTTLQMGDAELDVNDRLTNTNRQMDELIDQGRTVLGSLQFQGGSLRGIRKKVLDVGSMLGLSNTTLRLIEKRTAQDKVILFGGMVITTLIMFFFYRWIKG